MLNVFSKLILHNYEKKEFRYIRVLKPLRVNNSLLVTATEEKSRLLTYERHHLGVRIRRGMVDVYRDSVGF